MDVLVVDRSLDSGDDVLRVLVVLRGLELEDASARVLWTGGMVSAVLSS